jgi:hypothetical protein
MLADIERGWASGSRAPLLAAFVLAAPLGCSSTAPEPGLPVPWSCLDQAPEPPAKLPDTVTYTLPIVEWQTGNPVKGRTVKVCCSCDISCSTGVEATVNVPDESVDVALPIKAGSAFMRIEAPGFVPVNLFPGGSLYSDQLGESLELLPKDRVTFAPSQLPEGATGLLAVHPYDCTGSVATDASYSISQGDTTTYFTLVDGTPQVSQPNAPAIPGLMNAEARSVIIRKIGPGEWEPTSTGWVLPEELAVVEVRARQWR